MRQCRLVLTNLGLTPNLQLVINQKLHTVYLSVFYLPFVFLQFFLSSSQVPSDRDSSEPGFEASSDSKAVAALIGSFAARLLLPLTNYAGNVWQKINQEVTASAVSEFYSGMVAQVPGLFSSYILRIYYNTKFNDALS